MTESQTSPEATPSQREVVQKAVAKIAAGKNVDLGAVWSALLGERSAEVAKVGSRQVPDVVALTDEQRKALRRLPEVYGSVVPLEDRRLTEDEMEAIVVERTVIDTILAPLKKRKEESIREVLANHLDHLLEAETPEADRPSSDPKGHYRTRQDVSVPKTGKKVQRTVTDPEPYLTAAAALRAYEDGAIDRATYLKITTKPDVPRVLDESGLTKAVKKDPSLMLALAQYTERNDPVTTIKVVNDTQ